MLDTIGEILRSTNGVLRQGNINQKITGIMVSSSKVRPGQMYFDIAGGKPGNDNILKALENGAKAFVISRHKKNLPFNKKDISVIAVPRVGEAFWDCIRYYRNGFNIPMVGVTGSSGKTTTKEMIASIFRTKWRRVLKTVQNQNLPSFVPSHILRLTEHHRAAVFEIGMQIPGQVSKQSRVIKPQIGIITNIGQAHVGNFGSKEGVIKEKASIMVGIPENGYLLLNADDANTQKIDLSRFKGKVLRFGINNKADFVATDIKTGLNKITFKMMVYGNEETFKLPVSGRHNVYNALAAIGTASVLGIDVSVIKKGLAIYRRPKLRLQIVEGIRNSLLISDCYNANPDSVIAGLESLKELSQDRKSIAVLGNMLEQGVFSREAHERVGKKVHELGIDYLITVGDFAKRIAKGALKSGMAEKKIQSFDHRYKASFYLRKYMPENAVCLFKASRAVYLERTVEFLKAPQPKSKA